MTTLHHPAGLASPASLQQLPEAQWLPALMIMPRHIERYIPNVHGSTWFAPYGCGYPPTYAATHTGLLHTSYCALGGHRPSLQLFLRNTPGEVGRYLLLPPPRVAARLLRSQGIAAFALKVGEKGGRVRGTRPGRELHHRKARQS